MATMTSGLGRAYAKNPPAQPWSVEVASARDFAIIKDAENGPMHAFTRLAFNDTIRNGLNSLSFSRHYGPNSPLQSKFGSFIPVSDSGPLTSLRFKVSGWHNDPAQSRFARLAFRDLARPFFPFTTGQDELLDVLGEHFANLASGMDRRTLKFLLRAMPRGGGQNKLHFDPGSEYVGITYIKGITTPHADPASFTPADIKEDLFKHHDVIIGSLNVVELSPAVKAGLSAPPEESAAIWRGEKQPRPSAHYIPPNPGPLRLLCLTSFDSDNNQPAHRQKPGFWQRMADCRQSRYF